MITSIEPTLLRATPESQGVSSAAVLRFIEAAESQIHELHSFMLLRHGMIIAEGWWSPYRRENPHMLFSLSKSFTSTAVGFAVSEGLFSVDDPVLSFFPDETPAEVNEHLAVMKVRHLLSMSTGHITDTTQHMIEETDGHWSKGFFEVPVLKEPGTHFLYNTGATYMLSAIVQKTSGMKLMDYLEPRLFQPLGIKDAFWNESPEGINVGGFGLNTRTDDIARFGQLYLQKGMWEDKRILSEAWINEATAFHVSNGADPKSDWNQGYGYQFWRCQHNAYRADGAFGQYCVVMPEQDAVLAITGGLDDMQKPLNLLWEMLLPAMSAEVLPDDLIAQEKLFKKLSALSINPVQGELSSSTAAAVSGRSYRFDANGIGLETIALDVTESGCTVKISINGSEETFACGYGVWTEGQTTLFNEIWEGDPKRIVTSGAWTAQDTFTIVIRLHETPFVYTLNIVFADHQVMIERRVNVSFGSLKPVMFTARA